MPCRTTPYRVVATPYFAIAMACLLTLFACEVGCKRKRQFSSDSSTPTTGNLESGSGMPSEPNEPSRLSHSRDTFEDFPSFQLNSQGSVRFIQITEINRDNLPDLAEDYQVSEMPLIRFENEQIIVCHSRVESAESPATIATLTDFELDEELDQSIYADAPLTECELIVRYVVVYAGTGRTGERVRWYGFRRRTGEIVERFAQPSTSVTYDPSQDVPPFSIWIKQLRWGSEASVGFQIDASQESAVIQMNEAVHSLSKSETIELSHIEQSLALEKLPLLASTLFANNEAQAADDVIFPGDTFRDATLTTTINARDLGVVSLVTEEITAAADQGAN